MKTHTMELEANGYPKAFREVYKAAKQAHRFAQFASMVVVFEKIKD